MPGSPPPKMPGPHSTPSPDEYRDLSIRFTYHAPKPGQVERYEDLRLQAQVLAVKILDECPPSRERSLALTKLEEAVMWANAAIARNE